MKTSKVNMQYIRTEKDPEGYVWYRVRLSYKAKDGVPGKTIDFGRFGLLEDALEIRDRVLKLLKAIREGKITNLDLKRISGEQKLLDYGFRAI